jgi:hypothetical protein
VVPESVDVLQLPIDPGVIEKLVVVPDHDQVDVDQSRRPEEGQRFHREPHPPSLKHVEQLGGIGALPGHQRLRLLD